MHKFVRNVLLENFCNIIVMLRRRHVISNCVLLFNTRSVYPDQLCGEGGLETVGFVKKKMVNFRFLSSMINLKSEAYTMALFFLHMNAIEIDCENVCVLGHQFVCHLVESIQGTTVLSCEISRRIDLSCLSDFPELHSTFRVCRVSSYNFLFRFVSVFVDVVQTLIFN